GELEITNCEPLHMRAAIEKFRENGVEIEELNKNSLRVKCHPQGLRGRSVTTAPFPKFPTDMQAQYMSLMTQAEGASVITETIFENRFMHASELIRMGANIDISGNTATVHGKTPLSGAPVLASDLRASASLVLAALCAAGETLIDRVYHIDRGYETIVKKLNAVGADIERITDSVTMTAQKNGK
ncbi:MAG: UDP-N-acetylglucosamine 1-carboxyvinyltransferase, partial [Pyrinomonadaceae bacterium]